MNPFNHPNPDDVENPNDDGLLDGSSEEEEDLFYSDEIYDEGDGYK